VAFGHLIVTSNRLANKVDCRIVAADLVGENSKQMKTVEVAGIGCQYLAVNALGVRSLPCPMVPHRRLEKLHLRHDGPDVGIPESARSVPPLESASNNTRSRGVAANRKIAIATLAMPMWSE
jgi:hypothetical protein